MGRPRKQADVEDTKPNNNGGASPEAPPPYEPPFDKLLEQADRLAAALRKHGRKASKESHPGAGNLSKAAKLATEAYLALDAEWDQTPEEEQVEE